MMHTYSQSSGNWRLEGESLFTGYSGNKEGKNNPLLENVRDVGPIPRGLYQISEPFDTETHGPFVMRLMPIGATYTFGRSGFLLHGDSITNPGTASEGCIVASRLARERVAASLDNQLTVIG